MVVVFGCHRTTVSSPIISISHWFFTLYYRVSYTLMYLLICSQLYRTTVKELLVSIQREPENSQITFLKSFAELIVGKTFTKIPHESFAKKSESYNVHSIPFIVLEASYFICRFFLQCCRFLMPLLKLYLIILWILLR